MRLRGQGVLSGFECVREEGQQQKLVLPVWFTVQWTAVALAVPSTRHTTRPVFAAMPSSARNIAVLVSDIKSRRGHNWCAIYIYLSIYTDCIILVGCFDKMTRSQLKTNGLHCSSIVTISAVCTKYIFMGCFDFIFYLS